MTKSVRATGHDQLSLRRFLTNVVTLMISMKIKVGSVLADYLLPFDTEHIKHKL